MRAPMIYTEELHQGEVNKMLRKPGDVSVFSVIDQPILRPPAYLQQCVRAIADFW